MNEWRDRHLQMIYYGRQYCTAKNHTPKACPICSNINSEEKCKLIINSSGSGGLRDDIYSNSVYMSAKKSKGIIFYQDRIDELSYTTTTTTTATATTATTASTVKKNKRKKLVTENNIEISPIKKQKNDSSSGSKSSVSGSSSMCEVL